MKDYGFELFWSDEDQGYIATCPDFPGLSAFGKSPDKALKEAYIAMELFIEDYEQRGEPLPEPTKVTAYSGQIRLRMPKELHSQLAKTAAKSGVSLNTYLVSLLSERNAMNVLVSEFNDKICNLSEKITQKDIVHHHHHEVVVLSRKMSEEYYSTERGAKYGKVTYNN
jgi:predicted RNase H-like HicB family nuclease